MDFLEACNEMAGAVYNDIRDLVGTPEAGKYVRMGADQTPTKYIDQVAEDRVVGYLEEHPLCRVLISEELGKKEFPEGEGTIFLDPIDGTFNAVTGIPFYAISIARGKAGIINEAFVCNLSNNETFTAVRGSGAFRNGRKLRVSTVSRLDESAMSIYGRKFDPARMMQLGQKIRRWRLLGASAIELCYVGCGRVDAFVDLRGTLRVTDAAAGMLICTEAGGRVSDLDGREIQFPDEVTIGRCLVATNGVMHHKVIEYLR